MADRVALASGPRHWLLEGLRIHDTGSSGVKLVMKSANNTFKDCEVYGTGARLRTGGHGIEAVQSYGLVVQDCYIHDVPAAGAAARPLQYHTARCRLQQPAAGTVTVVAPPLRTALHTAAGLAHSPPPSAPAPAAWH